MKQISSVIVGVSFVTVAVLCGQIPAQTAPRERALLKGHRFGVAVVVFGPDGKLLAAADAEGVKIWNLETLSVAVTIKERAKTLAIDSHGKLLATGGGGILGGLRNKEVKLWRLDDGMVDGVLKDVDAGCQGVAFSPDGKYLAVGDQGLKVRLWEVKARELAMLLEAKIPGDPPFCKWILNRCVSFSPDGKTLAVPGSGLLPGATVIWDVATGKQKAIIETRSINSIAFSPDGNTIVSTSSDDGDFGIYLWDTSTGKQKKCLNGHSKIALCVAASSKGLLASASADKTVKLWNLREQKEIATLMHPNIVASIAISSDGKTLASGCMDGIVRLWDVDAITKRN